jgi:hypothetical protein
LTNQISTFSNSILAPATGTGLGDARFSNIEGSDPDEPRVCDRAGYWKQIGDKRIFLLRSDALLDAAKGHDLTEIGNALKSAGALYKNGDGDHLALARTVSTNSVGLSVTAPSRFAALNTIRKLFT